MYEKRRNTLFNVVYKPPNNKTKTNKKTKTKTKNKFLFNKNKNSNKNYHIAEDFNLSLLDHDKNKKSPRFFEFNTSN